MPINTTNEGRYEEKLVSRQFSKIRGLLKDAAKIHRDHVRMVTKTVHPKTIERFREEGFIVWENNETTLIKIPLQK